LKVMRLSGTIFTAKERYELQMNYPAAPLSGIAASLGQATGYPAENNNRPKGRGIKPLSAEGGLIMDKDTLKLNHEERLPGSLDHDLDNIVINEIQLLLAEKRTSLAILRTGIAVSVLPLSVLSVLIATSKYYDIIHVMHLLLPLLGMCAALIALGAYLIIHAIVRIRNQDHHIQEIKRKHSRIAEFMD